MKLEEAKEILNWSQQQMRLGNLPDYSQNVYQAEIVVLQELEHLQKENEQLQTEVNSLKEIDLTTVHIKGVCDEKDRWRNKIREKIEEIKNKKAEDMFITSTESKLNIIFALEDLLKEE